MQQFTQLRFYNTSANGNNQNMPQIVAVAGEEMIDAALREWSKGDAFARYLPATQLGISAPPGTRFYINNNDTSLPVIIGYTGLFEIDLSNGGSIVNLTFDAESIKYINSNPSASLIVDLIYEPEEG